jgi:hypothetical protein
MFDFFGRSELRPAHRYFCWGPMEGPGGQKHHKKDPNLGSYRLRPPDLLNRRLAYVLHARSFGFSFGFSFSGRIWLIVYITLVNQDLHAASLRLLVEPWKDRCFTATVKVLYSQLVNQDLHAATARCFTATAEG